MTEGFVITRDPRLQIINVLTGGNDDVQFRPLRVERSVYWADDRLA